MAKTARSLSPPILVLVVGRYDDTQAERVFKSDSEDEASHVLVCRPETVVDSIDSRHRCLPILSRIARLRRIERLAPNTNQQCERERDVKACSWQWPHW